MSEQQTAEAPVEPVPVINKRLSQFIALRDKIEAENKAHDERMKPLKEMLLTLHNVLLEHLNTTGGDSVSVRGVGTFYRTTKASASIADGDEFRRWVIGGEKWDMIDWKANGPKVADYLTEHNALPPGINFKRVATVGVRRA